MTNDRTYRIVVGHDLGETGDRAVEQAAALALRMPQSELHVVHAARAKGHRKPALDAQHLDEALVELRARVNAIVHDWDPTPHTRLHVRFGSVLEVLQQIAVDYDAHLVVVGTHGYRGVDRLRGRSIAAQLVRQAHMPVMVAKQRDLTGFAISERPEPRRPGEDLHGKPHTDALPVINARVSHISVLL
jgi:nucleotide-binding universal stress UspA family protein